MLTHELMHCTGTTRDTIRHYEDVGLLHDAHFTRRPNGYRVYNNRAIERIKFVQKAQKAGFTLSQIANVADEWENDELPIEQKRAILRKQLAEVDHRITNLKALREEIQAILSLEKF